MGATSSSEDRQDTLLAATAALHSDVVGLVEAIEECEEDGGYRYQTEKTRKETPAPV